MASQLHALAHNLGNFMPTLAMPRAAEPPRPPASACARSVRGFPAFPFMPARCEFTFAGAA
jgi:hypothetical protein